MARSKWLGTPRSHADSSAVECHKIEDMFNIPVTFVDTGKAYDNIIDMRFHKKALEFSRIDEKLVQFV